jgi:hypothetical protein
VPKAKLVAKAILAVAISEYYIVDIPYELIVQRQARTFDSFSHFECYRLKVLCYV